ncbi:hypothetical protein FQ087_09405 [Sporosarcina sp. ANT_H38]|nr:hypothetical protein FQ087_09405 [Sporosarcina sp. ANT_H38]
MPLAKACNGKLTSEKAGKVVGSISGNIAQEQMRMTQEQMAKK